MRHVAIGLCRRPADGALLLEHGYDRIAGLRFYRAIGGACEPGEGPAAAVVREWREEFALALGERALAADFLAKALAQYEAMDASNQRLSRRFAPRTPERLRMDVRALAPAV